MSRIAATTFSLEDNLLRRGSYDLISTPEIDTCICSDVILSSTTELVAGIMKAQCVHACALGSYKQLRMHSDQFIDISSSVFLTVLDVEAHK